MATSLSTTVRTALAQAIITAAGAGAKMKIYNGTQPANAAAALSGNTLLATLTFGSVIGTATSGTIDFDEAGATQSNGSHVSGTPTFCDITTSADVVVARGLIGSGWTFTGTVAPGQNVTLTSLVVTAGNA
jgi:hypothetical protein